MESQRANVGEGKEMGFPRKYGSSLLLVQRVRT
jgi:hypothetical protein